MPVLDAVTIANMALAKIGIGQKIEELTNDAGDTEREANFWYPICRDRLLEAFNWQHASKQIELDLVEEDPTDDWARAYRMPNECLVARRLVSGLGTSESIWVPFQLRQDSQGTLIDTDLEDAVLEGTFTLNDPSRFTNMFGNALAWVMASEMAMPLSVESSKRAEAEQGATKAIRAAQGVSNQNRRMKPQPASIFVSYRGGGTPTGLDSLRSPFIQP
jgi:hypothetical protein